MLRIRPDFYFLKNADFTELTDHLKERIQNKTTKKEIILPVLNLISAAGTSVQKINDWGTACERSSCEDYFNIATYWGTCISDLCCWGWGAFYSRFMKLVNLEAKESKAMFPVTLVRKLHVDCDRVRGLEDQEALESCYNFAVSQDLEPMWTCYIDGKVVISRKCKDPKFAWKPKNKSQN
mmetsp:Transcript_24679/g.59397  ORF Transcript_24679/g.59397 Transcript_24679/m.59397 type:complete len:180 (-) Transcript_24679:114-653(-)